MGGIRNVVSGNFTGLGWCRRWRKEVYEAVDVMRIRVWVKNKAINGLLTVVDNQRGRIEVSGATRIQEVTYPKWNIVPHDRNLHIHLGQSKFNTRGASEWHRRARRAAQRGVAGHWRGWSAGYSVPNIALFVWGFQSNGSEKDQPKLVPDIWVYWWK